MREGLPVRNQKQIHSLLGGSPVSLNEVESKQILRSKQQLRFLQKNTKSQENTIKQINPQIQVQYPDQIKVLLDYFSFQKQIVQSKQWVYQIQNNEVQSKIQQSSINYQQQFQNNPENFDQQIQSQNFRKYIYNNNGFMEQLFSSKEMINKLLFSVPQIQMDLIQTSISGKTYWQIEHNYNNSYLTYLTQGIPDQQEIYNYNDQKTSSVKIRNNKVWDITHYNDTYYLSHDDGNVYQIRISQNQYIGSILWNVSVIPKIRQIVPQPNNSFLYIQGEDRTELRKLNTTNGSTIQTYDVFKNPMQDLDPTYDYTKLQQQEKTGGIYFMNFQNPQIIYWNKQTGLSSISRIYVDRDGYIYVLGYDDKKIQKYDINQGLLWEKDLNDNPLYITEWILGVLVVVTVSKVFIIDKNGNILKSIQTPILNNTGIQSKMLSISKYGRIYIQSPTQLKVFKIQFVDNGNNKEIIEINENTHKQFLGEYKYSYYGSPFYQ